MAYCGAELSVRQMDAEAEVFRHLGFEDENAEQFSSSVDVNGITWERFSFTQQQAEIADTFAQKPF